MTQKERQDYARQIIAWQKAMLKQKQLSEAEKQSLELRLAQAGHSDPSTGVNSLVEMLEALLDIELKDGDPEFDPFVLVEKIAESVREENDRHRFAVAERINFSVCQKLGVTQEAFNEALEQAEKLGIFKWDVERGCYVERT